MPEPPLAVIKLLIRSGLAPRIPALQERTENRAQYLRYYSDQVLTGPAREMLALEALVESCAARESDSDLIDMTLGAPDLTGLIGPERSDAINSAALGGMTRRYPPALGMPELREALAVALERERRLHYDPRKELFITNGASQALSLAIDAFLNPGDFAVVLDPSFFLFGHALRLNRVRIRWVKAELCDGETLVPFRHLERALRGARMIFLNSPTNPTGHTLGPHTVERIAALCERHDVLIFSDEVYDRFVYGRAALGIAELGAARGRTVVVNSFSKRFGMASARIGYVAAPEHLSRPMMMQMAVRSPGVNLGGQLSALEALSLRPEFTSSVNKEFEQRLNMALEGLGELASGLSRPSGAFYVWLPVERWGFTDFEFMRQLASEKSVLVLPGRQFGPSGRGYVRVSLCLENSLIREGMRKIADFIRENAAKETRPGRVR